MLPKIKVLDWDDVPENYKYRAQDENGALWYYESKPMIKDDAYVASNGDNLYGITAIENPDWRNSLEERPKPDPIIGAQVVYKHEGETKIGTIGQDSDNGFFYIFTNTGGFVGAVEHIQWKYLKDIEL